MDTVLRQLEGKRSGKGGVVTIKHAIDQVIYDGKLVGWLGRHTNAKLLFLPGVPDANKADIRNQCEELRRQEGLYTPIHGEVAQAPLVREDPEKTEEEIDDE